MKPPCWPNGPIHGMSVTPRSRPMTATSPWLLYRYGLIGCPRSRARRAFAAYVPPWMPPWATPGVARSFFHGWTAASPTTKTSGWPGIVRSGPTRTRPLRSVSAPVAAATLRPKDEASTPAAQSTVRAWISSVPPVGVSTRTSPSSTCTTLVFVRTITRSFSSWRRAEAERPGGKVASTRSIASTSTIRASWGLIERKSWRSVSWAISPSAPASSTPVGPPPMITNVIHAWRWTGSASRSAASNAIRIRRRISVASSMVLRPGAYGAQSSWPKYAWWAPVATISVSYGTGPPSESRTSRFPASTSIASPSSTVVLRCLRKIERSGCAISPGDSAPVATWYSIGWNRWWFRRSIRVTSTRSPALPRFLAA